MTGPGPSTFNEWKQLVRPIITAMVDALNPLLDGSSLHKKNRAALFQSFKNATVQARSSFSAYRSPDCIDILIQHTEPLRTRTVTAREASEIHAASIEISKQVHPWCDLLILTAVSSEEEALKNAARDAGLPYQKTTLSSNPGLKCYDLGLVGSRRVMTARCNMGSFTHKSSAYLALALRSMLGAHQGVICAGIAFGCIPERQKLGDVMISSAVIPYDDRSVKDDPSSAHYWKIQYDADRISYDAKPELVALFKESPARKAYRCHVGGILTGMARIHSGRFRESIQRGLQGLVSSPLIGGEMEGLGLLSLSAAADPSWIIIKSISDFADCCRDQVIQVSRPVACQNAMRFLLDTLTEKYQ